MTSQQGIEAVTQRVKQLRRLEDDITKTLSARVNELCDECVKAVSLGSDSHNVSTLAMFRLDCYSEFLQNLLVRVQDASLQMEGVGEACKYPIGLKSISTLVERIGKLESTVQTMGGSTQDTVIRELQAKVDHLTRTTEHQNLSLKQSDQAVDDLSSELNDLKQRLEEMEGEEKKKTSTDAYLQDELEKGDGERRELRDSLRKNTAQLKSLKKAFSQSQTENLLSSRVVARRLSNLETLRDAINQLTQQAQGGPSTSSMGLNRSGGPSVGFSASVLHRENEVIFVQPNSLVSTQLTIEHNVGSCFKQSLGHFVAPRGGLYVFYVGVKPQLDSATKEFRLCVMSNSGGGVKPKRRMHVVDNTHRSTLCMLELQKDALVYLFCSTGGKVDILDFCGFSVG